MKKLTKIFFILAITLAISCNESKQEGDNQVHDQYALDYITEVGAIRHNAETAMNNLNNAIRSGDTVLMNKVYEDMLTEIMKSIDKAGKLGPLYDDNELQAQLVSLLKFYYITMAGPFKESLELQKKPDSLYTDNDILRTAQILDSISKAQSAYIEKFEEQLKKTALENRTIIKYDK